MADKLVTAARLLDELKLDEAVAAITPQTSGTPTKEELLELGMILVAARRPSDALTALKQAETMDPDDANVKGYIGQAHYFNQDYTLARKSFQQAITLDRDNIPALNGLGLLEIELENYATAENVLTQLLDKQGPLAPILTERAYARAKQGKTLDAITDCTLALETEPDYVVALQSRANLYASLGEHDLAWADQAALASYTNASALIKHTTKQKAE